MSISKLISRLSSRKPQKIGEPMSYDALFKGAAGQPSTAVENFLPGLRAVENDVDTYFKEVFAGTVF